MSKFALSGMLVALVLTGCATQEQSPAYDDVTMSELTGQWHVESIDQAGVIDSSRVTMTFDGAGQVSGSTGCNRYTALMSETGKTLQLDQAATTRMACPPALMKQEQRFLQALQDTKTLHRLADTWVVAEDGDGKPRLKMIEILVKQQSKQQAPLTSYYCGAAGEVGVREIEQDTIELSLADQMLILPRVVSASGTKYGEGEVSFWDKGHEARFESGGRQFLCHRIVR